MPYGGGRLDDEEAAGGGRGLDAPAPHFTGDVVVVGGGVVGVEAQAKAALAGQRSVAAAPVAAHLGEDGEYVIAEAERLDSPQSGR